MADCKYCSLLAAIILLIFFGLTQGQKIISLFPTGAGSSEPSFGKRILVIAPHPDDETLAAGGLIKKSVSTGKKVKVVVITSGDGFWKAVVDNFGVTVAKPSDFIRLGQNRVRESLKATKLLGINRSDVVFLGYPDGGLQQLWEDYWVSDRRFKGYNGKTYAPYNFAYEKRAPYFGLNLCRNISEIIEDFHPTDIVYPDPYDQNNDHRVTNAFVKYSVAQNKLKIREWNYLVHRGVHPYSLKASLYSELQPPYELKKRDGRWSSLSLNNREYNLKMKAINVYSTQMKVRGPFLKAFVQRNELFSTFSDRALQISSKLNYQLFPEPSDNTTTKKIKPDADITSIGAALTGNTIAFCLTTKSRPSLQNLYVIKARIIYPEGIDQIYLRINKLKIVSDNRTNSIKNGLFELNDHKMQVVIPKKVGENGIGMMVTAEVYHQGKQKDRTAWRYIIIDPNIRKAWTSKF